MSRNARVLELIVGRAGGAVARTRLMKIVYMADLLAWRVLGEPISEFHYKHYHHGPFDPAIYAAVEELCQAGHAEVEEGTTTEGPRYDYDLVRLVDGATPHVAQEFTPGQLHLVDLAVKRCAGINIRKLITEVIDETEPMKGVPHGQPLDMEAQRNKDRDARGGISLETILEAREWFIHDEGLTHEEFIQRFRGAEV